MQGARCVTMRMCNVPGGGGGGGGGVGRVLQLTAMAKLWRCIAQVGRRG